MAEADQKSENEEQVEPKDSEGKISALMLSAGWRTDTYGIAALTRSLVNDLWLTDPEGHRVHITCAVLEEEGKISENDLVDACRHNVKLRGAKRPRFDKEVPSVKWLDKESGIYYRHLILEQPFDFIIGHMPYTVNGAFNLQDTSLEHGHSPKVILVVHALPRTSHGDVDSEYLIDWLTAADAVLSVGHGVEAEISSHIRDARRHKPLVHKLYLPSCPIEMLTIEQSPRVLKGKQVITLVAGECRDLDVTGLDYELAIAAAVWAADNIIGQEGYDYTNQIRMQLMVLASSDKERSYWQQCFEHIKQTQPAKYKCVTFCFNVVDKTEKLKIAMENTTVLLLPLKPDSHMFGIEALCAASAGTPLLASSNSGIASLLQILGETRSVVHNTGDSTADVQYWQMRTTDKLTKPDEAFREAQDIRQKLLLDTTIASSHLEFVQAVCETASVQLKVEFDPKGEVSDDGLDAALTLGVRVDDKDKTKVHKFILAFIMKLLCQREKIKLGLLDSQLTDAVKIGWEEVLSLLEDRSRKLIGLKSGSILFILFCPTAESRVQLRERSWKQKFTTKLLLLLRQIGVKLQGLSVGLFEPKTSNKPILPRLVQMKKRYIFDANRLSDSGHDSVSTSDTLSQASDSLALQKVEEWLATKQEPPTPSNRVLNRWDLDHLPMGHTSFGVFAVGESGNLGISSIIDVGNSSEGTLSMMYPNHEYHVLSPSQAFYCWHPIFVKHRGKEYLAAYMTDSSIHMWDIEAHTSQTVFAKGTPNREPKNMCLIDDKTVACSDVFPSADGTHKVYILGTNSEPWTLRSTIVLTTGKGISDMCYMKIPDGTPCLLLCRPYDGGVAAVEMVGGRIRWKTDKDQMGDRCRPWSICTYRDNVVYVADSMHDKVYRLSGEDGAVVNAIHLSPYDMISPHCVRVHNDLMYVAHRNTKERDKWQISQLTIERH